MALMIAIDERKTIVRKQEAKREQEAKDVEFARQTVLMEIDKEIATGDMESRDRELAEMLFQQEVLFHILIY